MELIAAIQVEGGLEKRDRDNIWKTSKLSIEREIILEKLKDYLLRER